MYPLAIAITDSQSGLKIGQDYQGGKIAYLNPNGISGLIVDSRGQTSGSGAWSPENNFVSTQTSIGSGNQNSINMNAQGGGSAIASACLNLSLNGYTDWYLPSRDELQQVYLNRVALGITSTVRYWSSSQHPNEGRNFAYAFNFANGQETQDDKQTSYNYFAMRSF